MDIIALYVFIITTILIIYAISNSSYPAQLSGLAGDQTTGRELLAHLAAHLLHSYNKVKHPQLFSTATPAGPPCEGPVGQRAGLDLAGSQPRRVHQGPQGVLFRHT